MAPAKTAVQDPFAQASNGAGNGKPEGDPFGQPATGGNFPKLADLWGCLIMITPRKIEEVPDNFNKGQTTNRLTADVLVIDGPPVELVTSNGLPEPSDTYSKFIGRNFPRMWINSGPIVKAADVALDEGTKAILGRLWRFPVSDDKDKYEDRWELERALNNWRPGQAQIRSAWSLERYTDEDAALARQVIAKLATAKAS
jgi:hypothetical protein